MVVGQHVPGGIDELHAHRHILPTGDPAPTTLPAPMTRPLVRGVFALLAVATIAAFFVTQQLKASPARARFAALPAYISPNGDGFRDDTEIGFDLSEPARVTFSIVDSEGNEVRRIVDGRRMAGDTRHRFRWDGRDGRDAGAGRDVSPADRPSRREPGDQPDKEDHQWTTSRSPSCSSARPSVIAERARTDAA